MSDLDFTLLDEYAQQLNRRDAARTSTALGLGNTQPNAAAEALEIARNLGVPPMAVVAQPDRFRADFQRFTNTNTLIDAPITRGWVDHDAMNAALAQDDLANLSGFERTVAEIALSVEGVGDLLEDTQAGRGVQTGISGAGQMATAVGTIPVSSMLQRDFQVLDYLGQLQDADPNLARHEVASLLGIDANSTAAAIAYDFLRGDEDRRQNHIDRVTSRVMANEETMTALVDAVNAYSAQMQETQGRMPNFTDIRDVGDFADWLSFNTGQAIPYMAATVLAGAIGGAPGVIGAGYGMGVGDIQSGLIEEGITDQGGIALAGGIPYAGLELLGPAARPFRGVGGDVLQEVAQGYLRRLGREFGENAVEEFINEAGQEIIRDYAVQAGGGEEVILNNETLLRWFNAGMAGAGAGGMMAAVSTSPVQRDIERADAAGGTAEALDRIDATVAASQLRQRAPDRFLDFANQTGAGQQLLYVPADGLREYAQARDMTDEDLEAWGVDLESLDQMAPSGGVVSVPISNYAAMISGTDDAAWFRENATRSDDEMSLAEAAAFNDQVQEVMQEAFDEVERQRLSDEELRASDVQIYDQVFSQLRAAGRSPDVAQNEARVWSAFWVTMGERYGEDPLDLARSMGVRIQSAMTPEVTRRRNQTDVMLNELRRRGDAALRPRGMSILDFVMSEGGVMDPGGEVAMLEGPAGLISESRDQIAERQGQPNMLGLPSESRGTTMEDMARRVAEAGYWPDLMGVVTEGTPDTEVDLTQRLLDALSGELAGERVYLDGEGPDANLTQLSEALSARGIDLADVTNDEAIAALEAERDGVEYDQSGRLITDSPEFREWFGDSQVVDENGDPLVVYHGSPDVRGILKYGFRTDEGAFFSSDRRVAETYADDSRAFDYQNAEPFNAAVYLSIQNPMIVDAEGQHWRGTQGVVDAAREDGHDGVIIRNTIDEYNSREGEGGIVSDVYVVFEPGQVKSAMRGNARSRIDGIDLGSVENVGTFDRNDPRILYQSGTHPVDAVEAVPFDSGVGFTAKGDPRLLEANFAEMEQRTFATGRELKEWLQDRALQRQQEAGIDLTTRILSDTPQDVVDAIVAHLGPLLEEDARYAFQDNAGAIGWYDRTVTEALNVAGMVYPEINTDPNARMRFIWALAVTSNGIKVDKNFDYAAQAYDGYKQAGRFPQIDAGEASKAINHHLQLYHDLSEAWGDDNLRRFMMTPMTVSELKRLTGIDVSGENSDTVVRGAAILGAKIGNGFYSNLNGVFDALTIDRWNMRTMGRLRGTLIEVRPEAIAGAEARLQATVDGMTPAQVDHLRGFFNGKSQIDPASIGPGMASDRLQAFANEIKKRSASPEWRDHIANRGKGRNWAGDEIRKAGNSLWNWMDGQVEIASNGSERNMIRAAHQVALENLQADPDLGLQSLNMSDLQALLWYPEKRLYDAAKQKEGAERGYEDDDAPDYANAARKWAERRGVSAGDRSSSGYARPGYDAEGEASVENGGRGFSEQEWRDFRRRAGIRSLVGGGDPTSPRAVSGLVTRKSLGDGASVRGLSVLQKLTAPRNRKFGKWMSDLGVALPPLYELDASTEAQAFADAITASKAETPYGAAVYVYPVEEYAEMRLYMTEDGGAGFAVKSDGDIVSVFGVRPKGTVDWLMQAAIDQGGRKLDAFDTVLPSLYSRHGFKVVERLQWDDQYAPDNWDYDAFAEFDSGRPDVVFMQFDETYYGMGDELRPQGQRTLYQGEETRRGSIVLPSGGVTEGQTIINLFEGADLSTVIHESGHFFYEAFEALASQENAPQAMKTDLATLQTWMGVKPGERPSVDAQERMARGFERYVMEGKSPSIELASAFSRFKAWLTRIYRQVTSLNVNLTDEVREVFDRMLATDAAIEEAKAEASMRPLFREAPAGMTDTDFRAYQRLGQKAEARAEQNLLERTMEKVRRRKEAWWKEERKATEAEVTESVNRRRAHRLVELLANKQWIGADGQDVPDMRIDRAELVEMFGEGVLQEISRTQLGGKRAIYGDDGSSPGEVAQFFGYENAMEMIEELQNTGKRKEVIKSETDRLMEERHGDPLNDGSIEAEAMDAIHSIQQGETIAAEARQLAKQRGQSGTRINNRVFRYRAQQMIARMSVRDASRPQTFLSAERKAARVAERAFAKVARGGRGAEQALAEAYQAKEQQLLNHHLYMEAREVERLVERGRERMRNYDKATVRKKLEGGYIEQIDALLERFDFRRRSPGQVRRSESLRDFMDRMIEEGREAELMIPPDLADESRKVHYSRMSVEELRGLFDAVANLDHMGRFKQKLIDRQKARDLAESAGVVAQQIRDNFGTGRAKQESRVRNTFNLLWTADTMLVEMDGLDEFGPAYRQIKEDIDAGQAEEQRLSVELAERLEQLFSVYSAKELREMQTARVRDGVNAKAWSKLEILAAALNTGNADNLNRLLAEDAHPDVRMNRDQLDALLSNLDKRDWDFVQSMWDMIDGYWPEIRDVTKRRTGVAPGKVDAVPVVTPYGTYRGGYYPIKYDPGLSANANLDDRSAFDDFVSSGRHGKAQTANGHTIKRKQSGNGRTLMLDMNVAFSHLRDVVRDIALSEAVDNSYRILNHPDVVNSFIDAGRQGDHRVLNLWLKDTAKGPIYNTDTINSLARMVKNNFTLSRLAFNMKTVALQITGVGQSAATVGKRAMLRGFQEYLKRPNALAKEVVEMSPFMAERQSTFQKDIYDFANDVKVAGPLSSRWANAKSAVSKAGFAPIVKVQFYAVDMPTWLAGYNVGIERFGNEAEAIQYADRMVARSQDSGLMGDRNAVSRGTVSETTRQSDFIRLFTTLAGYMMTKMNRANITIRRGAKGVSEGSAVERIAAATNMATDLMLLYVSEAVMMALMYGLMTDEDEPEDYPRFIGREIGSAVFGGVPFVRDAAGAFNGYGGGGVYGSVLEVPANLYQQATQMENDRALRRAIGDVVGIATGLPTTATLRGMEWIADPDEVSPAEALFGSNPLTR